MFGFLKPPKIPAPVRPDDFTRTERDRLRDTVVKGDPLRDRRDQSAIDRLLTNSVTEITGPTGAFTLAQREHGNDQIGRNIAEVLRSSDEMEEERRYYSEQRLGQLESERNRDLDEYDQMVQAHQAAEEVARKNWQSGLLRAGAGLLTLAAPGIGAIAGGLLKAKDAGTPRDTGFNATSPEAAGRMFDNWEDRNPLWNNQGGADSSFPDFNSVFGRYN